MSCVELSEQASSFMLLLKGDFPAELLFLRLWAIQLVGSILIIVGYSSK